MSPSPLPEPAPDPAALAGDIPAASSEVVGGQHDDRSVLPTETDIYILPDGQVVIADLPVELAPLVTRLGHPVIESQ